MKGLERLVGLGKAILRGARVIGYAGAASVPLIGMSGDAKAEIIHIWNYSPGKSCEMSVENVEGGSEGLDGIDSPFTSSPTVPSLEIYANPYGTKLMWNALPVDTSGSDFYLGSNGFISSAVNSIKTQVESATNLKSFSVYDTLHPETKYSIPLDGSIYTISLPDLVNQPAGEYAHWRLDVNDVPEPSSLALAGAGVLAVGAWGVGRYLGRRGRKEEYDIVRE